MNKSSISPAPGVPSLSSVALPIFGELALQMGVGILSMWLISQQSVAAAAAVNTVFFLVFFGYVLLRFVTMGASVVATQYLGAGERKSAQEICYNALTGSMWMGALCALVLSVGADPIFRLWSFPQELLPYAKPYLQLLALLLLIEAPNLCLIALLRAYGQAQITFVMNLASYLVQVLGLCAVLYGWNAPILDKMPWLAIVALISRSCFLAGTWWLQRSSIGLKWRNEILWKMDWLRLKPVMAIGMPAAAENLAYHMSFMLIMKVIGMLGAKAVIAQSFVRQIMGLIMLFGMALGLATEVVIGYQVGAGDLQAAARQLRRSLILGWVVTATVSIIVAIFAEPILRFFTLDTEYIEIGVPLMRLCILIETGRTFNLIVINALRAAGDSRFPVMFGVFSMWGVAVPLAWLLGLHSPLALVGVWLAYAADEWVRGLANLWRWRGGKWRKYATRIKQRIDSERAIASPATKPIFLT
ncbi:MAG: MATE family efflux transporter [Pseudomonadota bacterium]